MKALVLHSLFEVHAVMLVADDFDPTEAKKTAEYYNQSASVVDVVQPCLTNDEVLAAIREQNGDDDEEYQKFVDFTQLSTSEEDLTPDAFEEFKGQDKPLAEWWAENQGKFV